MQVSLDDKYEQSGPVYLSGPQSIVRAALEVSRLDSRRGWRTAGFVSGYRGSPLGGLDAEFVRAQPHLQKAGLRFQPGINEDLAATAVWGTQQVAFMGTQSVDGVFSIWYGKGPGVDRTGDVFKHGNLAGASPKGGVLVVFGDDHGNKSSSFPHQSEYAMVSALIPVLYPATLEEYVHYGVLGIEMSRFSGCWIGFKAAGELVESSATADIGLEGWLPVLPEIGEPPGGLHIRMSDDPHAQERRMFEAKIPAVQAFAAANNLNRRIGGAGQARLVLVTAGKAYLDTMEAMRRLCIDNRLMQSLGLRVVKLGMTYPLVPVQILEWVLGAEAVLVVEEKRPLIEDQLAKLLLQSQPTPRPRLLGKSGFSGETLLPPYGELSPGRVAGALVGVLEHLGQAVGEGMRELLAALQLDEAIELEAPQHARRPYFCAGCPHNGSTRVPEGSRALAGIGCHAISMWMPQPRAQTVVQMGGEGVNWIGMAPFVTERHVFQNLGDGTYFHSGLLALRAAVAARVNITYKILFNDAVAMTGGQPHDGPLTAVAIARQVAAEGVAAIAVVADDPSKYRADATWPPGTRVHAREELDQVQRRLRALDGVSVLIYDQVCAAEKRRRRKRGAMTTPARRLFINQRVCEGCGDCGVQSNCVAIQPAETSFGRKRRIDQSTCNRDYSCADGFCPSFVSVHGGKAHTERAGPMLGETCAVPEDLPPPKKQLADGVSPIELLVVGMGGTGVVTIGALLGMAAHLEGRQSTVLDQTGIAQKNGTVASHVRIGLNGQLLSPRIGKGRADVLLAADLVVAASSELLARCHPDRTRVLLNSHLTATPDLITDPDVDWKPESIRNRVASRSRQLTSIDFTAHAESRFGDALAANAMLLGCAFQLGLLPLREASLRQAIRLNGAAVQMNLDAFDVGRRVALERADSDPVRPAAPIRWMPRAPANAEGTTSIATLAAELRRYQGRAYSMRFKAALQPLRAAETRLALTEGSLISTAARALFKLMAYKDEYEVARLYTDGTFKRELKEAFEGPLHLRFHLAPPLLARRDRATGQLRKTEYGPWVLHAFAVLARLRFLRGTPLDIFGYTAERRAERRLIADYIKLIESVGTRVSTDSLADAQRCLRIPEQLRGYGHVKEAAWKRLLAEWGPLSEAFDRKLGSRMAQVAEVSRTTSSAEVE